MSKSIRNYNSTASRHAHDDFHQIIVPIKGDLELDVSGKQGVVTGRTIGIVTLGEQHAFRAPKENSFIVLDIKETDTDNTLDQIWNRAIENPFTTMSQALLSLSDYAAYCFEKSPNDIMMATWQKLFLQTLASELNNDLKDLPKRLQKVMSHIESNFGSPLTNADMADITCLSPSRFHQIFQNSIGISPQQYLQERRLNAAKKLIIKGHSLAEVADEVGFSDQSTFGRAFKKVYDISPSKWRQNKLKHNK